MEYLVPILMLLGLGVMAYFMTKGNKQQTTCLKETANLNGWSSKTKSDGAPGVYQISGTSKQGKKWELNAFSRSSAEDRNVILHHSREYTEWTCPITNSKGELLVMPRDPSWKSFSDDQILGFIKPAWKAMGLPAEEFIAFMVTNKEIENKYMIYTTNQDLAMLILQEELLKHLLNWQEFSSDKKSLVNIRISSKESSLQLGYLINKPEEVEKLVTIGEIIVESL
jgi:hypothetical protein